MTKVGEQARAAGEWKVSSHISYRSGAQHWSVGRDVGRTMEWLCNAKNRPICFRSEAAAVAALAKLKGVSQYQGKARGAA